MGGAPDDFRRTVEQCILMELQAMTLYTILANRVEDSEAARILRYLAESEESHVGRVADIFSSLGEAAGPALSRIDVIKAYGGEAWSRYRARVAAAGLSDASSADDFLAFALENETEAQSRYERLAGDAADLGLQTAFRLLAREEAGHAENVARIRRQLKEGR